MERSIDELLNGTPDETPIADDVQEPEIEAAESAPADEGQPRGPDGKFLPKQTGVEDEPQAEPVAEAVPPAADQLPKDVYEPLKAVRNENRELKQQIAAIQAQLAQQPRPQVEPPPAFWDDPDRALEARMEQFGSQIIQRFQQQQVMERISASETAAKGKYTDYDDAFHAFQQAANMNPTLVQQMTASADPAEFAYRTGKRSMDLERVGSMDELLKAERAKWEAEARAAIAPPAQTFPATTAADGSVASRSGPAWAGPGGVASYLS